MDIGFITFGTNLVWIGYTPALAGFFALSSFLKLYNNSNLIVHKNNRL